MTATSAWLILPIAGAFLTIPNYLEVLRASPTDAMLRSLVLGIVYGVGGLTFGLGIRYIGFSLNYAIAIGFSACLGTIPPLLWHPNKGFTPNLIVEKFSNIPGLIVLAGILFAVAGIAVERELADDENRGVGEGLPLDAGRADAVAHRGVLQRLLRAHVLLTPGADSNHIGPRPGRTLLTQRAA